MFPLSRGPELTFDFPMIQLAADGFNSKEITINYIYVTHLISFPRFRTTKEENQLRHKCKDLLIHMVRSHCVTQ